MTQQDVHLVIASGGTGGHFFPALAVAREARAQAWRVTLVVAGQHAAEHLALAKQLELPAFRTPAVRLPHSAREWISFCPRFAASVLSARRQLKQLEPDLVLGLGSFAAAPVCLASGLMRIPLALHEANAKVGRANRVLARWARVLASSLPLAPGQSCRCPCVQTGLPLRDDLIQAARNETPASDFYSRSGLSADLPTLLVFGGSQGAEALNRLMPRTVAALEAEALRFQVIHLTGRDDNAALTDAYAAARVAACVRQAESHIENCYLAADLVVCRAGAASISELALFGKPAVLVPFPASTEDHQTANARVLADREAACLLPESEATVENMTALLRDWLQDPDAWRRLGRNARSLAAPRATEAVVQLLRETLGGPSPTGNDPGSVESRAKEVSSCE